ncbi:hypothetical protein [Acaryochloris marina]|uniref:Uncharacterized protein n=1 Tax=Acaryochloris marina (strain MBIC 11017) TaxID=329726 RepID=B0CFX5_ACAM1|nr:hypothetical protein [Acaryochloris marina]ABW29422.1 hypothetical protein AM1_4445 [Acaryochloris marina MBIC11017]BDM78337.1 hypothetical protein AM10699_12070 [Acaryochloris marina MBIC10699]
MPNPKLSSFANISLLERLTKQDIFKTFLNLALYLSFILPLSEKIHFPDINSPWKDFTREIALIFLLSGFGFSYWISGFYIRFWLISIRIELEFRIKIIGSSLGVRSDQDKSPMAIYVRNTDFLMMSDIVSYLSKNENKFLEKIYEERLEMNKKYRLNKENTVTTLTLCLLHWYFKSELFLFFVKYTPDFLPAIVLSMLLWASAEPFPEGNNYFHVPGNPIRDSKSRKQS